MEADMLSMMYKGRNLHGIVSINCQYLAVPIERCDVRYVCMIFPVLDMKEWKTYVRSKWYLCCQSTVIPGRWFFAACHSSTKYKIFKCPVQAPVQIWELKCQHGICCGLRALANGIKGFCYCIIWIRPLTALFLLWILVHREESHRRNFLSHSICGCHLKSLLQQPLHWNFSLPTVPETNSWLSQAVPCLNHCHCFKITCHDT